MTTIYWANQAILYVGVSGRVGLLKEGVSLAKPTTLEKDHKSTANITSTINLQLSLDNNGNTTLPFHYCI